MNYRHAFHAGNFADCMKHALLVWLLRALQRKQAPVFVLDTHAGAGRYELGDPRAERTGEWRTGIGLLLRDPPAELKEYVGLVLAQSPLPLREGVGGGVAANPTFLSSARSPRPPPPFHRLTPVEPWAATPSPARGEGEAAFYPGSPLLLRALMRPSDRLACCELHPEDHAALRRLFAHDPTVAVHRRDGWDAIGALLPPAQKRGLVLIDPPYEQPGEFERVVTAFRTGAARFPSAVYAAWYPVKHRAPVRALHDAVREAGFRDVVCAELFLREPTDPARLNGCGLLVRNPPWGFESEAPPILAALLRLFGGREPGEGATVRRLTDE